MTPRATRVLTLVAAGALTLSAAAAWACDRSKTNASTASAAACPAKVTAVAAKSCAGSGSCSAHSTLTAKKAAPAAKKSATATAAKKPAKTEAGLRAYRDPETGLFTSAPEVKTIGDDGVVDLKEAPVTLSEVPLGDGKGYMVDLQGFGQDFATMRLDAKGNRVLTCAPARGAKKIAPAASSTPAFPEK